MKRFTTKIIALFSFVLFAVSSTYAATINVNYSLSNGEPVTLAFNGTMNTYGLEFSPINLDFDVDGTYDLSTIGYCVELTQGVGSGDTYSVDLLTATGNYLAAAWIMDNYAGSNDSVQNAAVQIAIWEAVYDGIGDGLSSGTYQLTSSSAQVTALANQYVSALVGANLSGLEKYMIAANPIKQDLLVAVPIPAAAWLFASGLMGLIGFRKHSAKS